MANDNLTEPNPNETPETPEAVPAVTVEGELAAVTAERDQLLQEKADLADRLLRRQAEFENYRRRAERDRMEFAQFAAMDLVQELLPVLDDFARAAKVETADREYQKGVDLIYQRFETILKKAGLEPLDAEGKAFDPNLHQAVDRATNDDVPDQTVLQEYQKGYNFKGKLLRPAMVKVAVKS